jgi:hypothetical protein
MVDFEEAKEIAKKHIGDECGLIEKYTIEKHYGWYLSAQSKRFIETGNFLDMTIGSGGFLVERENGRVIEFGSAYSPETWLENYEKGFKYNAYDLTILQVKNLSATIEALLELDMQYVIPELENGVEWRIPKYYTFKELKQLLSNLPYTFKGQSFWHRVDIFDHINETKCCNYSLSEYRDE